MSVLGPEKVLDGDFDGSPAGVWTLSGGATIGSGVLNFTAKGARGLQSIATLVSGRTYNLTYTLTTSGGTSIRQYIGGATDDYYTANPLSKDVNIVCGSADTNFYIEQYNLNATVAIDNISIKELSTADTIEKAIFDILRMNSTVSGLVSARIYPEIAPQGVSLPYIVYSQISGVRDHTLASTSTMVPSRFQFTCVAETYAELRTLSDAIRGVLDNFSDTAGTVVIQCAHFIDENDLTNIVPGTDKLRRYMKAVDFYIYYNE